MRSNTAKYQQFLSEMSQKDTGLLESLESGSIPLLHIENHNYRDVNKAAHREKKGGIYLQNYLPAKKRAIKSQIQFRSGHLKEDTFDPDQPHKNHAHWLKIRDLPIEGPPMRFGKGVRTENERIQRHLSVGDGYVIDHAAKDTKMVHHPDWKPIQPHKWASPQNIDTTTCMTAGPKSRPPWEEFPIRFPESADLRYIDGFDKIGENMHRFRDKKKENNKPEFISTIGNDVLGKQLHISKSLRTMKAQQVMGIDPKNDQFSKTSKLPFYKQSLIETKSVDHFVPYFHSQNVRGNPMKDLMPVSDKIYKLSLKQSEVGIMQSARAATKRNQESMDDSMAKSNQGSPMGQTGDFSPLREFKDSVKPLFAKPSTAISSTRQGKQSRGSQGTTNATWTYNNSRAMTAKESASRKKLSHHHNGPPASSVNNKLLEDQYYIPTNQEAKDLVLKYFP